MTKFDWCERERGRVLKPLADKNPRHTIVLFRPETFRELYDRGYLSDEALRDAKKEFKQCAA